MVRDQIVPADERASESCLHCEINDLVQEYIDGQDTVDIAELVARMAESVVDLILLAPEDERANLLGSRGLASKFTEALVPVERSLSVASISSTG
jgi:hypothetical protein